MQDWIEMSKQMSHLCNDESDWQRYNKVSDKYQKLFTIKGLIEHILKNFSKSQKLSLFKRLGKDLNYYVEK